MSCSVVALPIYLFAALASMGVQAIQAKMNNVNGEEMSYDEINNYNNYDITSISVSDVVEKEFETNFMDKELLLKTMEEHGIQNIQENDNGEITGVLESFNFHFHKPEENKPYVLKLTCRDCDNAEEKISDISSEYVLNSQEAAYLSIIENIKNTNMQIESETVEEDNTIVLTINLE